VSDLKKLVAELSQKEITRKQFLAIVAGSLLGVGGLFRVLQSASTPDLANSDRGVFGEREYGNTSGEKPKQKGYNSEDVFG
jgi:hypothetical protein